jgi:threonine dehydratase
LVDRVVTVDEQALALAVLRLSELEKTVVEGAAAAALAATFGDELTDLRGKRVVLLLCGGNIDMSTLGRVIDHGLAVDGRLWRFQTRIVDRPGGIAKLTATIAAAGASVLEIVHDRTFSGADVFSVTVEVTVQTADQAQVDALRKRLLDDGFVVSPASGC